MSWKVQTSEFMSEFFNNICKINLISLKNCNLQKTADFLHIQILPLESIIWPDYFHEGEKY